MKNFIVKTGVFTLAVIVLFLLLLTRADGATDNFYLRFTTPTQKSLILGTSRAAQGLLPKVVDSIIDENIYNYSFTVGSSPYGETYLKSIKKKLNKDGASGTFILAVDPWSISSTTGNPEDSTHFRELDSYVANAPFVTQNPNLIYLLKSLKGKYFYTVYKRKGAAFLHDDGWLEISVPMSEKEVARRTKNKMAYYAEEMAPKYQFSKTRLDYLKRTIQFLDDYGDVYLVRLPVHPEMMDIENALITNFNDIIAEASSLADGYLDLTSDNSKHQYTDGNHLHKKSGRRVSKQVANWIVELGTKGNSR